jgi:hypothetical protein
MQLQFNTTLLLRGFKGNATIEYMKFWKRSWDASQAYKWDDFKDPFLKRQFKLMKTLGMSMLPEEKIKQVRMKIISKF